MPEAVRNYLCLLGWSPKDDREMLRLEEVVARFDLANVNRKARTSTWQNAIGSTRNTSSKCPMERYRDLARPYLEKAGIRPR